MIIGFEQQYNRQTKVVLNEGIFHGPDVLPQELGANGWAVVSLHS